MEFFINQGATLPILKMQVVKDGIADITEFMSLIENSLIYFSMIDVKTGGYKILNMKGGFVEKTFIDPNAETEYYVYYKFTSIDTNREGLYEGEFVKKIIVPENIIKEKLTIKIGDSHVSI